MFDSPITSLKREIFIRRSPERVWKALTVPEELNRWETRSCSIDLTLGGKVELDYGWGVLYSGTIIEMEENVRLIFKDENEDLTIWTIEAVDGGTLVGLEYTGVWTGEMGFRIMEDMAFGTEQFFRNMKSVLEEDQDLRHTFWTSWIGVHHRTLLEGSQKGSIIVGITKGTPSEGVLHTGDILIGINEYPVQSFNDFESVVTMVNPGQSLLITVLRDDVQQAFTVNTAPFGAKTVS
ncbi:SRPBCC domain-containing protein [Paenibacillus sp. KN14-4R]|uniref:SRPBCC domain-containing protein n=1 Tax=Paenibacillus sp. KN14-4R TaxID=3445773 RepID=UPI003FA05211